MIDNVLGKILSEGLTSCWRKMKTLRIRKATMAMALLQLNAYRVLLTRARAGMVICVPTSNPNKNPSGFWEDSTRLPKFYDGTYQYLKSLGIEEI